VEEVRQAGQQLAKESPNVWSEHDVAIKTVPKGEPTTPAEAPKRVGVFFGVSEYQFNDIVKKITNGQWSPNLRLPQNDAADTARVLKQVGRLTEARVLLN